MTFSEYLLQYSKVPLGVRVRLFENHCSTGPMTACLVYKSGGIADRGTGTQRTWHRCPHFTLLLGSYPILFYSRLSSSELISVDWSHAWVAPHLVVILTPVGLC